MAYDEHWGPGSGEGSVASINWVEKAVTNTLAEGVPSEQIVLGMPFYSKIWTLTPTIDKETNEVTYSINDKAYGMTYSKNWMNNHVKEPVWLEDCGQWYGEYTEDDVIYKLWLEDNDSLIKRLELMKENSLAGAAFWRSGFDNKEIWDTIIKYIN
ncbi:MAG: glycosyl hydrolase family 18, partial [Lachnospiraceae bacterium]|nr:glycosyl hydrolase family 18 [Lachnospiraceae bacterium]